MPVIIFEGSKLTKDQKVKLAKELTTVSSKIVNLPEDAIITLIKENDKENISVAGQLLAGNQD